VLIAKLATGLFAQTISGFYGLDEQSVEFVAYSSGSSETDVRDGSSVTLASAIETQGLDRIASDLLVA
jgi:hypothetical protein